MGKRPPFHPCLAYTHAHQNTQHRKRYATRVRHRVWRGRQGKGAALGSEMFDFPHFVRVLKEKRAKPCKTVLRSLSLSLGTSTRFPPR
jgi:hypothetical protein